MTKIDFGIKLLFCDSSVTGLLIKNHDTLSLSYIVKVIGVMTLSWIHNSFKLYH